MKASKRWSELTSPQRALLVLTLAFLTLVAVLILGIAFGLLAWACKAVWAAVLA